MDINNLIENVRSFFIEQYKNAEKSNLFISFEPLGSMIDPSDFKEGDDDINQIKATEQLSILGDRLPQIDDVFLPGTSRLSDSYDELIKSAVFTGIKINAEDKSDYIARFTEIKSESGFKLEEAKKASIQTPEGSYLPVYGYPKKWYDPKSAFWVNKTFSAKESDTAPPPVPPVRKPLNFGWRTKVVANTEHVEADTAPTAFQHLSKLSTIEMLRSAKKEDSTPIRSAQLMRTLRPGSFFATAASPVVKEASEVKPLSPSPVIELKSFNLLKNVNLAERVNLINAIVKNDTTAVAPVHSNEFSMSFDYCLVYLDRPWFNTSFFHYANMWFCLSLKENFFSSGTKDETNTGVLKCIPTAMILIKDLRISAAWTDDDKTNAANSIGLGFFNINKSEFINNELVTPGMQIIGWMCEVMPKIPAISDPSITF